MSHDSVTLKWSKPHDTGGVPLSGYIVEQQEGPSSRWRVAGYVEPGNTWWSAHGLRHMDYKYRVRAENADGAGTPAALGSFITPGQSKSKDSVCQLYIIS